MPWCAGCDRFYNPNSLNPDGTCPTCGRMVAEPAAMFHDQNSVVACQGGRGLVEALAQIDD